MVFSEMAYWRSMTGSKQNKIPSCLASWLQLFKWCIVLSTGQITNQWISYPIDSNLSSRKRYALFEQLGPDCYPLLNNYPLWR